jgi:hypothetical protein
LALRPLGRWRRLGGVSFLTSPGNRKRWDLLKACRGGPIATFRRAVIGGALTRGGTGGQRPSRCWLYGQLRIPRSSRMRLPQSPARTANPRNHVGAKPCLRGKSPPIPAQPGSAMTGLARDLRHLRGLATVDGDRPARYEVRGDSRGIVAAPRVRVTARVLAQTGLVKCHLTSFRRSEVPILAAPQPSCSDRGETTTQSAIGSLPQQITQDGAFMEPSGRNRWQPVANGPTLKTAKSSRNRCRGLRPVAATPKS